MLWVLLLYLKIDFLELLSSSTASENHIWKDGRRPQHRGCFQHLSKLVEICFCKSNEIAHSRVVSHLTDVIVKIPEHTSRSWWFPPFLDTYFSPLCFRHLHQRCLIASHCSKDSMTIWFVDVCSPSVSGRASLSTPTLSPLRHIVPVSFFISSGWRMHMPAFLSLSTKYYQEFSAVISYISLDAELEVSSIRCWCDFYIVSKRCYGRWSLDKRYYHVEFYLLYQLDRWAVWEE